MEEGGDYKVCMRCGKLMPAGATFCNSCGADLMAAAAPGLQGAVSPREFEAAMGAGPLPPPAAVPAASWGTPPPLVQPLPPYTQPYPTHAAAHLYGPYQTPYPRSKTDDLAIASLVCAIASFTILPFFTAVAAIVIGFVSRERIRKSEGLLEGNGLALAGILVGVLNLVLCVAILLAVLLVSPAA